jgi:hypothetical protein
MGNFDVVSLLHAVSDINCIIIQVRQQTQQYLEIVILVNIYGYMFRLILSHLQDSRSQNSN